MKHILWNRGDVLVCVNSQHNLTVGSSYKIYGLDYSPGYDYPLQHQVYLGNDNGHLEYYRVMTIEFKYNFILLSEMRKLKLKELNKVFIV